MKFFFLFLLAILGAFNLPETRFSTISGQVFHDKNGNRQKDADEPGLPNVVVSDQVNIALTNHDGLFELETTDLLINFDNDDYYGPTLLTIKGALKHRHIVENYADLKKVIGDRPYPLALAGHYHAAQEGYFVGSATRFAQTSAITRPDRFDFNGFKVRSGFTVYEVADGKIVKSTFIPLNLPG